MVELPAGGREGPRSCLLDGRLSTHAVLSRPAARLPYCVLCGASILQTLPQKVPTEEYIPSFPKGPSKDRISLCEPHFEPCLSVGSESTNRKRCISSGSILDDPWVPIICALGPSQLPADDPRLVSRLWVKKKKNEMSTQILGKKTTSLWATCSARGFIPLR